MSLEVGDFEQILKPFPRLISVNTGYVKSLPPSLSFTLPPIRVLSYQCDKLSIVDSSILASLPILARLDVKFNDMESTVLSTPSRTLTALEQLSLHRARRDPRDEPEWPQAVSTLISQCPNLTELKLSDSWLPYYEALLPSLTILHPRLEKLELATSDRLDAFYELACDRHLPLFGKIRHLDLADNTLGSSLCSYLRQLPYLVFLRLGRNTHLDGPPSSELLSLVQGSTKLVSLETLVLDCLDGKIGHRLHGAEEDGEGQAESWTGWVVPEFGGRFKAEDLRELALVGPQNRVKVDGSAVQAAAVWDAYHLEIANRKVDEAFKTRKFNGLVELRRQGYHRCPVLDLDELDPNDLKLVKIDLPEENWFALSLE